MRTNQSQIAALRISGCTSIRTAIVLAAAALLACTGRSSSAATVDSAAAPSESAEGSGTGHLHLTGDVTVDHDFAVDACQIAPPGAGLLSGYHMNSKDGDSTIVSLAVVVKDYDKDGPYSPADKSEEGQLNRAMATGDMGIMQLMVARPNSPMPLAVMLKPTSTFVVTISGRGAKGDAEFKDMESPLSFEDIDLKSGEKPHGKKVSGTVTWSCGHIDRLDPTMNKAVNSMFDGLTKNH
ncbi:MAG: hypothetical protein ACHQRL_03645 [Gemmatimonadales bacterium]|jgi:hypothetical protein